MASNKLGRRIGSVTLRRGGVHTVASANILELRDKEEARAIQNWDPVEREEHCSNCLHCVVSRPEEGDGRLLATCEAGMGRRDGRALPLARVIQTRNPYAWRAAAGCPGFVCMTDDKEI